MAKSIFERIADWIQGDSSTQGNPSGGTEELTQEVSSEENNAEQEETELVEEKSDFNDYIQKQSELITSVTKALKSNYRGANVDFSQRVLILWIEDTMFFDVLNETGVVLELRQKLSDELGFDFKEIVLRNEAFSAQNVTKVMPQIGMSIASNTRPVIRQAMISSVEGCGSLLSSPITLDANAIQKLPGKRYNVGISAQTKMTNGLIRTNHIAIDDNPASPQFDKNRFVSRAHAFISYAEDYGFMLHVEVGGTRSSGKRTHVIRNGVKNECDNPIVPTPLQDGDVIVLSRNVMLNFNVIK